MIKALSFLHQLLLHSEQIPILANRMQQVVEEVLEFLTEIVPDEDDVVSQVDLVLA